MISTLRQTQKLVSKATVTLMSHFTDMDIDEILDRLEGLEDLDDIIEEPNLKNLDNAHNEIIFIDYDKSDVKSGNNGNSPMGRFE